MSDVAIVRGDERRQNILKALELIEEQISLGERIVVKPNMVSVTKTLSGTHAEALDGVLDFIRQRTDSEIVVAEGSAYAKHINIERQSYARFGTLDVYILRPATNLIECAGCPEYKKKKSILSYW